MKLYSTVVFDQEERDVLIGALAGQGHTLTAEGRDGGTVYPLRVLHTRVSAEEPFDAKAVAALVDGLHGLIERLEPETKVEWWREQGAPGADDAVEGLAATRVAQVARARAALDIAIVARSSVGAQAPTRRDRMAA